MKAYTKGKNISFRIYVQCLKIKCIMLQFEGYKSYDVDNAALFLLSIYLKVPSVAHFASIHNRFCV